MHDREHERAHTRKQDHPHGHEHARPDGEIAPAERTKALLGYMIDHNEHHAEELAELLDGLEGGARKKLLEAIGGFEVANVQLREVLTMLEGEE